MLVGSFLIGFLAAALPVLSVTMLVGTLDLVHTAIGHLQGDRRSHFEFSGFRRFRLCLDNRRYLQADVETQWHRSPAIQFMVE